MRNSPLAFALGAAFLGVLAGMGLLLLTGWVIGPIDRGDATLADLAPEYKEDYIVLVGAAYAQDHDLDNARARLALLEAPNPAQWVAELADTRIRAGGDSADLQYLVELADGLGMANAAMIAYLATDTPVPSATPSPTPVPTDTATPTTTFTASPSPTDVPPTDTEVPPTDTPLPPTDTPLPPTATPVPPTKPPKPTATQSPPTATPKPPAPAWSWSARLVGPNEDGQGCTYGNLQIRVTVLNAAGNQIPGVWIYDRYSQAYMVTGNVDSPDWGPGETKFEYGFGGGGSLCIAGGQGGPCISDFTRDLPCSANPPFEDKWAAGYCGCCSPDAAANKELCRQLYDAGNGCIAYPSGHYSWRVVFRRSN